MQEDDSQPQAAPRIGRPLSRKLLLTGALLAATGLTASLFTWAAFSATTNNGTNSWQAGSVTITHDDSGSAMFNVSGIVPGNTGQKCIKVTYSGSVAATVKLYRSAIGGTGLDSYIDLTVNKGSGSSGTNGDCTGFSAGSDIHTSTLTAVPTSYAAGLDGATFNPNDQPVYRFTWSLQDDNNANGKTATGVTFTWEARSS